MHTVTIDRRYKFVRETMDRARPQMVQYFSARYSWGQPCDPQRAKDWATLAGYLATCQVKGMDPEWNKRFAWESGNQGSPSGMVDCYHDGWELLQDLGVYDPEWSL